MSTIEMEENAPILIMRTHDGHFYPIEAMEEIPLEQQAKDHGELNNHVSSVEDVFGRELWKRVMQ